MKKLFFLLIAITTIILTSFNIFATTNDFSVYVKKDGIYYSDLNSNNEILLYEGENLEYPLISKSGSFVAFKDYSNLYVTNLASKKTQAVEVYNVLSYDWLSDNELAYSIKGGGLSKYNAEEKNNETLIDRNFIQVSEYYSKYDIYDTLKTDNLGNIYSLKGVFEMDGDEFSSQALSLICYNINNKTEEIVAQVSENKAYDFKIIPVPAAISDDGSYLYIWSTPFPTSNGVGEKAELCIYDVNNKKLSYSRIISSLFNDNISINPTKPKMAAFCNGDETDFVSDKTLSLFDKYEGYLTELTSGNKLSMTPYFCKDGVTVLFSAFEPKIGQPEYSPYENKWYEGKRNIYKININDDYYNCEQKITTEDYFDFFPRPLSNGNIMFIRKDNDNFKLCVTDENENTTTIAENLNFDNIYSYDNHDYNKNRDSSVVIDVYLN